MAAMLRGRGLRREGAAGCILPLDPPPRSGPCMSRPYTSAGRMSSCRGGVKRQEVPNRSRGTAHGHQPDWLGVHYGQVGAVRSPGAGPGHASGARAPRSGGSRGGPGPRSRRPRARPSPPVVPRAQLQLAREHRQAGAAWRRPDGRSSGPIPRTARPSASRAAWAPRRGPSPGLPGSSRTRARARVRAKARASGWGSERGTPARLCASASEGPALGERLDDLHGAQPHDFVPFSRPSDAQEGAAWPGLTKISTSFAATGRGAARARRSHRWTMSTT